MCVCVQVSQVALAVKNLPASPGDIRDTGSIPGSGRSPGGGHGNSLQYSCLENPMDRGAWWATVHRVTQSDTTEMTWHKAQNIYHVVCTSKHSVSGIVFFSKPFTYFISSSNGPLRQVLLIFKLMLKLLIFSRGNWDNLNYCYISLLFGLFLYWLHYKPIS